MVTLYGNTSNNSSSNSQIVVIFVGKRIIYRRLHLCEFSVLSHYTVHIQYTVCTAIVHMCCTMKNVNTAFGTKKNQNDQSTLVFIVLN